MKKPTFFLFLSAVAIFASAAWISSKLPHASPIETPTPSVAETPKALSGETAKMAPALKQHDLSASLKNKRQSNDSPNSLSNSETRSPAPLTTLSAIEAHRFPQGFVIDHEIQKLPDSTNLKQIRIIDSATELGLVRIEEIVDPASNLLLKRSEMRANTLLIKLNDGVAPQSIVSANPSIFKSFTQILLEQPLYEFHLASHNVAALPRALEFAAKLQGDLLVYAEPNGIIVSSKTPNDPKFPALWGLERIQAPLAWDVRNNTTSFPLIVAVVDTGIDYRHEDLKNNMWVNPNETQDGKDNDRNGYIDDIYGVNAVSGLNTLGNGNPLDRDGHGTHVAGTIAALGDNSVGVVGVCWNLIKKATPPSTKDSGGIMAVRCLTTAGGTDAWIAVGIQYAVKQGAKIINLSLGGPSDTNTLRDAVRSAQTQGVILVASAGNDGKDIDLPDNFQYPACYEFDNIVTVGASNEADAAAGFSNFGSKGLLSHVDIFAPGDGIESTLPGNEYGSMSGTSMAAPHVSGALALLVAQYPAEGYKGTISRLYGKADKIAGLATKCKTSARINLYQSILNISVRPTPPIRNVPNIRIVPERGTISRDLPNLVAPSIPSPRATPLPIVDRPAPRPKATPRAKVK